MAFYVSPRYKPVLTIQQALRRGDSSPLVRLAQEWLCLQSNYVALDGVFGPATAQAVRDFQAVNGLVVSGQVTPETFERLVKPMTEALRLIEVHAAFGQMVVAYARQHMQQRAREVGGQNRGPWVRLYLHGHERAKARPLPQGKWAWCAGFVSTVMEQAALTLSRPAPLSYRWNCTNLGREAQDKRRLIRGETAARSPQRIPPGSLMLVRKRRRNHWHHTGVVVEAASEYVRSIEGNSNHDHDQVPYGHEVALHTRSYVNLDFISLAESARSLRP